MDDPRIFDIQTQMWLGSWYLATIPSPESAIIRSMFGDLARGWGSIPVRVTIGDTTWKTSIFSEAKTQCYVLPIKAEIRKSEQLELNKDIKIRIEIII